MGSRSAWCGSCGASHTSECQTRALSTQPLVETWSGACCKAVALIGALAVGGGVTHMRADMLDEIMAAVVIKVPPFGSVGAEMTLVG